MEKQLSIIVDCLKGRFQVAEVETTTKGRLDLRSKPIILGSFDTRQEAITFRNTIKFSKKKTCESCENEFNEADGRPYKYDTSMWLCHDCHDERMAEED